jgi:hypothetical protein
VREGTRYTREEFLGLLTAASTSAFLLRPGRADAATSPFVTRSGPKYLCSGQTWKLFGASIYGTSNPDPHDAIADTVALAAQANLNTLRIVNFFDEGSDAAPTDPAVAPYNAADWARVDAILDALRGQGMKAILDLSAYRNCLQHWSVANGFTVTPYSQFANWTKFIKFVAKRVNSVNGVPYKLDPTIAFVSFAGEPAPPRSGEPLKPTTTELTTFYRKVFAIWKKYDKKHLLSSGGLLHIDWEDAFGDPNGSGIDWRAIFKLANNGVPAIHSYWHGFPPTEANDFRSAKVSAYCASIKKPWLTEEFGFTQKPVDYGTQPPTEYTEADRGDWYQTVYDIQSARGSSGAAFWNLGSEVADGSHDVNPNTPATWAAVLANAPG